MNQQQEIKKALTSIEKRLPEYVVPTKIKTAEQNKDAVDLVAKIKKASKLIQDKMNFYAKPHYNEYKRIRGEFSPYLDMLGAKEKELKGYMLTFHKAEQKRLDAEQAKIEAEALKKAKTGEAVEVAVVNDIKRVEAVHGASTIRKIKKWRVTNIDLVPTDYLMVNEKKVKESLKIGKVPSGIEEYYEDQLAITT